MDQSSVMTSAPVQPTTEHFMLPLADGDTLEALYHAQTKTRTHFLQVSSGPADLEGKALDLGGIQLFEAQGDGHHLWHDEMVASEWRVALLTESSGEARFGAIDLTPSHISILRPGDAASLLTHGKYKTLEINIPAAIAQDLGWTRLSHSLMEAAPPHVTSLTSIANAAFATFEARGESPISNRKPVSTEHWTAIILDQIDRIIDAVSASSNQPTPNYQADSQADIVRRVFAKLRDVDYAKSANIDALCSEIGVSRRSLFLAFQKQIAMGPRRLNELIRLHALRARLFRSSPLDTTIAGEAEAAGFSDFGRLSRTYRQVFGELPSDTLRSPNC